MKMTDRFTDYTTIGTPNNDFGYLISNDTLYKNYPIRLNFYIQLLDSLISSNPNVSTDIFRILNINEYKQNKENERYDYLQYYNDNVLNKDDVINEQKLADIIKQLNNKLNQSAVANNIKAVSSSAKPSTGGDNDTNDNHVSLNGFEKYVKGVTGDNKLSNDKYYTTDKDTGRIIVNDNGDGIIEENKDKILKTYKNSLEYGPTIEKVNMSDRVIFVIATYILRSVALFMVEWGVHINYVNNFIKAFSLYFGVYACIFLVLTILTNASEKDMVFRMLFFYINTQSDNGKGVMRILIHLVCLLFLFPIPFIVREYREIKNKTLSFTEKRSIINAVNKFTMLTWILTSIIALRL